MTTDPAAEEIADEILYCTGQAIAQGRFNRFRVHFLLPQIVETQAENLVLRTKDEIRGLFTSVQDHMQAHDIAQLIRTVVSAEFIDADTIGSIHVSKAVKADGSAVGAPYPTYSILKRTSDGWKIARSRVVFFESEPLEGAIVPQGKPKRARR